MDNAMQILKQVLTQHAAYSVTCYL